MVVGGEDPSVRAAEDREGREVSGMAAWCGGVDEDGAVRGPHDVAACCGRRG